MNGYDPKILEAMRGFGRNRRVPNTSHDCGGPLDGWGLSLGAIRGHLVELQEALARARQFQVKL